MNKLFRAALAASVLSLATACGGPVDDAASSSSDALTSNFDPVLQFAAVKKAASQYTSNIVAVSLSGQREATASTTRSTCASFLWVWTVMGSDGTFVDVQLNASGAKVLAHQKRFLFAGEATFDPGSVLVDAQDLLAIAATLGMGQPTQISLSSTLAAETTGPRWDVIFPEGTMTIDGVTGKTVH